MAATKKTTIAEAKTTDTKTEEIKTTPAESVAEPKKTTRKTTAKTASAKKTAAAKKTTAKKETVKKTTVAKKAEVKEAIHLEFAGKSYTSEDLVKIAKDVWKYDLNQKVGDFKTVELYVKPEESVVYYVINGDVQGSFAI